MDTRTAIVTGASSGIGLALAQAYQSRHWRGHAYPALRLGGEFEYSSSLPDARRRLAGGIADGRGLAEAFGWLPYINPGNKEHTNVSVS